MNKEGLLVIDAHAHAPRKGIPGVDSRPYTPPMNETEREAFMLRDMQEVLDEMDKRGTDKRALIAMPTDIEASFHFGEQTPGAQVPTYTCHEWIEKAVALRPERFFSVACINPLEEDAVELLEKYAGKGFKGVKIHQAHHNFLINDKRAYPFYERCAQLKLPVLFHTGYSPLRHIDRYIPTMPHLIDELAFDLPELSIVMCHCGGNWYSDGILITLRNENVTMDCSGLRWLMQFLPEKREAYELIADIVNIVGDDRVMYGTDNDEDCDLEYMLKCGFKRETLEKVMAKNAQRVFAV